MVGVGQNWHNRGLSRARLELGWEQCAGPQPAAQPSRLKLRSRHSRVGSVKALPECAVDTVLSVCPWGQVLITL